MTVQFVKSDRARLQWRRILDAARAGQDTVIEHYDTPTAAVIPYEDFIALREALEELRTVRRAEAAARAWEQDPTRGRDWEDVKAEMIRDGLLDA